MNKRKNKNTVENLIFLGIVALFFVLGSYFTAAYLLSFAGSDDAPADPGTGQHASQKSLNAEILKSDKVKQLVVHPREKFDSTKIKAGHKKCPFGGLE